jgi:hypothetical protein
LFPLIHATNSIVVPDAEFLVAGTVPPAFRFSAAGHINVICGDHSVTPDTNMLNAAQAALMAPTLDCTIHVRQSCLLVKVKVQFHIDVFSASDAALCWQREIWYWLRLGLRVWADDDRPRRIHRWHWWRRWDWCWRRRWYRRQHQRRPGLLRFLWYRCRRVHCLAGPRRLYLCSHIELSQHIQMSDIIARQSCSWPLRKNEGHF